MLLFFVIPGLTRNPLFFKVLLYWMPDQVRHDWQKINASAVAASPFELFR